MSEFETVLQKCLYDLERGASNVEECLQRYPHHATQLEPILLTSTYLARGRAAQLSPAFKARVRTRLIQQMHTPPQRSVRPAFLVMRLAVGLAAVLLAILVTGTAYAQRALPGESFYAWKIASENAWRMVSPDPLGTDLAIANRRLDELIAVRRNPLLQAQALAAYLQVTERLRSQGDKVNKARIEAVLDAQTKKLTQLDILPEEPTPNVVPQLESPTVPPVIPTLAILETQQVIPTELPPVVPATKVLPEILPTTQDPPKPIPTIELHPLIP